MHYGLVDLLPPLSNADSRNRQLSRTFLVISPSTGERLRHRESHFQFDALTPLTSSLAANDAPRLLCKCAVAYTLASLAVYWPWLDSALGQSDSKHVVATVAVYFHPARSKGSMLQSLVFVSVSLLFSFAVAFGCRLLLATLYTAGWDQSSRVLDLTVLSILLGFLSYAKHWVNKPTFNTATSLACISIVACILKESSINAAAIPIERLILTSQVVVLGCCISVACCFFVWPRSAAQELRQSLNDAYNVMSIVLDKVLASFLSDKPFDEPVQEISQLKGIMRKANQYTEEAQYELLIVGKEDEYNLLKLLVASTTGLSRHLEALQSSCDMKHRLLHQQSLDTHSVTSLNLDMLVPDSNTTAEEIENSTEIFTLFVQHLAPLIKSLVFTIRGVLLQVPFENFVDEGKTQLASTHHLQSALNDAVLLFEEKQAQALERVYSQPVFIPDHESDSLVFKAQQEKVAACCGNFALLLGHYAMQLKQFCALSQEYEKTRSAKRSWGWARKLLLFKPEPIATSLASAITDLQAECRFQTTNTALGFRYRAWESLCILKRNDVKFGIKVGLGACFISVFAYLPATKTTFVVWRGEWALAIYCIMMNKLEGGTAMTAKWRFVGTFLGVAAAFLTWSLAGPNPYVLCFTGFLLSAICFYPILFWKTNNAFGRFVLLAYNLTALYSYSMTEKDGEDDFEGGDDPIIGEIAFHRFVAVLLGIVLALAMLHLVLRNSARARIKLCITVLWLRLGVVWNNGPLDLDVKTGKYKGLVGERDIQQLFAECEQLLNQAPLEFRLKGDFPFKRYKEICDGTSRIINAYENMGRMITAETKLKQNEMLVLKYIEPERGEVEQRIFLTFYMLASSMRLGFPVPVMPVSTEHAMDRMLLKLNRVRHGGQDCPIPPETLQNSDFVLLYSYILMSREFAIEGPVGIQLKQNLIPELHRRYNCGDDALDIAEYIAVLCASNKPSSEIATEVRDTCGIPIDEDFVNVVFNEIERLVFEYENPQPPQPELQIDAVPQSADVSNAQHAPDQPQPPLDQAQTQSQVPSGLSQPPFPQPVTQPQPQTQFSTSNEIFTTDGQPPQLLSTPRVLVKPPPTGPKMLDRRPTHAGVSKRMLMKPRERSHFGSPLPSQIERALNLTNPAVTNIHSGSSRQRKTRCKAFPDCTDRECEFGHPMRNCNNWPNCHNAPGTCNYLHPDEDAELIERWEAKKKSNIEKKRNYLMVQQGSCKFGKDCTKDTCPFAHPTPANPLALLSTLEWCSLGKNCIDPLCVKAHPPPPTAKPASVATPLGNVALEQCKFGAQCTNYKCPRRHASLLVACRLGADCLRVDCFFSHPIPEPCRFGEKCLNKFCMYTHPPSREVLDNTWSSNGASSENAFKPTNQRAFAVPDDQVMEQAVQQ